MCRRYVCKQEVYFLFYRGVQRERLPQITLLQIVAVGENLRKGVFALSIAEGLTCFLPCAILEMAAPT